MSYSFDKGKAFLNNLLWTEVAGHCDSEHCLVQTKVKKLLHNELWSMVTYVSVYIMTCLQSLSGEGVEIIHTCQKKHKTSCN